jgi:hypothetical protein
MKRDWDLLRSILIDVESCEEALPVVFTNKKYKATYGGNHYLREISDQEFNKVREHVLLLGDQNLAKIRDLDGGFVVDRLTMEGHDFLDASRDESRWKNAMKKIEEKGGGAVPIGILIQILSSLMKQSLGIS